MRWLVLFLFYMGAICASSMVIVSIVDQASATACLIKIFSILESAESHSIDFKFLIFEEGNFGIESWESALRHTFSNLSFETKIWIKPDDFPILSGKGFDRDIVFARFYLPTIFMNISRFLYLDNDIIVTANLFDLYSIRLICSDEIPASSDSMHMEPVENPRSIGWLPPRPHKSMKRSPSAGRGAPATVGFVYENHPGYKDYLHAHFNMSHPVVQKSITERGMFVFLNAGVFIVDAVRWRQKKYTVLMQDLMTQNNQEYVFNSKAVGDQGPFLLLFNQDTTYLPAQYNMRRQPKKTVNLLSTGVTGRNSAVLTI